MKNLHWLGQASAIDPKEWETYLAALRDNMLVSWTRAVAAYQGLKSARETLGLPFIAPPGGEGAAPGMSSAASWSADLDQQAVDLMAMKVLVTDALNDAIAGKRKMNWDAAKAEWQIEGLPEDVLRLEVQGQAPVLVDAKTGQKTSIQGTVGVPAIVWGATLTLSVLALPAYFVVEAAINNLTDVSEQKTLRTITEKSYECVQSGKCTPDQVAKINSSITSGVTALRAQKVEQEKAKAQPTTDITSAIKTVAWVGLAAAVLFFAARLIPAFAARRTSTGRELAIAR